MKQTIVLLLAVILSCGFAEAVEYPASGSQATPFDGYRSPVAQPKNSTGNPFSSEDAKRPILRAGDPGDTGDDIPNTGGNDNTGNVNDNNVPVNSGLWFMILISLAYTAGLKFQKPKNQK